MCYVRCTLLIGEMTACFCSADFLWQRVASSAQQMHTTPLFPRWPPLPFLFIFFPPLHSPLSQNFSTSRPIIVPWVSGRSELIGCRGFVCEVRAGLGLTLLSFWNLLICRHREASGRGSGNKTKVNAKHTGEGNLWNSKYLVVEWVYISKLLYKHAMHLLYWPLVAKGSMCGPIVPILSKF